MRVYLHLESEQLGDSIAWLPYLEEYRKTHNCEVFTNFFYANLFSDAYPEINFSVPSSFDKRINIGLYDREVPLQQSASDALELPYREIKPRFNVSKLTKLSEKTITFSEFGSNYCKAWNNPTGWNKVIKYIHSIGYSPVAVSKEYTSLNNVIDRTGLGLFDVCNLIYSSDVYIGVSSGLAWLAWSLGVPVVMMSGHTKPYFEFQSNIVRLSVKAPMCFGCYNDNNLEVIWEDVWCPHYKNTVRQHECTYNISASEVIGGIKLFLKK